MILAALASGCASGPRQPYSASEFRWATHGIIGQSLDVATTSMALGDDRIVEGNPLWWSDDPGAMLAGKIAVVGLCFLVGEIWPEYRSAIWQIAAITGYGAAGWNTYLMMDNNITPWR
jgi:hypothetical protein